MMRKLFNGIWVTELRSPDGATALVADHGAHVLSWTPAVGKEMLYLSERSKYGGNDAIRGGVPIIFPQFGERGSGQRHGFARLSPWQQVFAGVEQGRALARYRLGDDLSPQINWPHRFELMFEISFSKKNLDMTLTARNASDSAWEFCAALHTYLSVSDIAKIDVTGLQQNCYLDQAAGGISTNPERQSLRIESEIDRIYQAVNGPVVVNDGTRTIVIQNRGFEDVVVWNPGETKAARISDMAPQDYRSFVCVEAAAVDKSVTLPAGESWSGSQSLEIGID